MPVMGGLFALKAASTYATFSCLSQYAKAEDYEANAHLDPSTRRREPPRRGNGPPSRLDPEVKQRRIKAHREGDPKSGNGASRLGNTCLAGSDLMIYVDPDTANRALNTVNNTVSKAITLPSG